jgi:hypothetical protein
VAQTLSWAWSSTSPSFRVLSSHPLLVAARS